MKKERINSRTAYCSIGLILLVLIGYSTFRILQSVAVSRGRPEDTVRTSKTVIRDGKAYFPRQDITVIMVMGIDENGPVQASESYLNSGEADLVVLLICDEKNEQIRLLHLNRDTMLEIPVLGVTGRKAGAITGQLALAHTYGSGLEDSCENVRKAVSDFLHGILIDYYIAANLDAIAILNDAVGGVQVTVTDDFSELDPGIPMGEHILSGEEAVIFVQSRKNLGDQLNSSRMERQRSYLSSFLKAMQEKNGDAFVRTTYEKVSPYVVTDCSAKVISAMMRRYAAYTIADPVTPEGKNVRGNRYYEFYPDEEKLEDLILELFYAPK